MKKSVHIISLCLVGYCYATLGLADDQKDIKGTNEMLPIKENLSVKTIKFETLPQNIKTSSQAKDGISRILGKPIPPSLMQRLKWESVVERDIGDTLSIPVSPDIKKFEVPICTRIFLQADLMGNDGVPEDYNMVSLMNCDGVNYVTPVKSQRGGSCGTYASTAALEILIAKQAALKTSWATDDHPVGDFSPINLSEGYSLYSSHYYIPTAPVLDGIAQGREDGAWLFASTVEHYYPDPLFKWNWGEWDPIKANALSSQNTSFSNYCQTLSEPILPQTDLDFLDSDASSSEKDLIWDKRYMPIFNCLFDTAKQENLVLASPTEEFKINATLSYSNTDDLIKQLLDIRIPVKITGLWWYWDNSRIVNNINASNPYFEFERVYPRPIADYSIRSNGVYYVENSSAHVVLIVGYLDGGPNGVDFWIVKNSHAANYIGPRRRDVFQLVQTASTSGQIDTADSTKRNLYLDGVHARYTFYSGVSFYQLSPQINSIEKLQRTQDTDLWEKDTDGDLIPDFFDNCPAKANPDQADKDQDFIGDSCDECNNTFDRYQDKSNPHLLFNDLDDNGKPDICQTGLKPTNGLGIIGESNNNLRNLPTSSWKEGKSREGWRLGYKNKIAGVGNFTNDDTDEFILRSSWGMAFIDVIKGNTSPFHIVQYGTDFGNGKWTLTAEDQIVGIGNFAGDSRDEIVIQGEQGLAFFFFNKNGLQLLQVYPPGSRMGSWRVGQKDVVDGVGDFNGDGKDEFIIRSTWGMGIFQYVGSSHFRELAMVPVKKRMGEWRYNVNDLITIGDFDGNGRDDLIFESSWGMGIVTLNTANRLVSINMVPKGSWLGKWHYGAPGEQIIAVGNFTGGSGDRKDEFIFKSPWGIGLLHRTDRGGDLMSLAMVPYGDRMEEWRLRVNDEILFVGDFNGNGQEEFLIKSSWGIGIIEMTTSNELKTHYIDSYGTYLGNWYLRPENQLLGIGNFYDPDMASVPVFPFIR